MNMLSAYFRLLIDFISIVVLLTLVLFQCTSTKKPRKVDKAKAEVVKIRSQEPAKKKKTEGVSTPKQSNEDPAPETPMEQSGTPAPAAASQAVAKSNRKKTKTEGTEVTVDPTQQLDIINQSATMQVCPTQDDEIINTAKQPIVKKKRKLKEEYMEDQNDDDTLACVKSIEN